MKQKLIGLLIVITVLLSGCFKEEVQVETTTGPQLFYINKDCTGLVSEPYTPKATSKDALVKEYIVALNRKPENREYQLAKPETVAIVGYNFGADGQLQLSFNDAYLKVDSISEVLMRAAVVKTFTQIEGIQYVEFYINGQPLVLEGDLPLQRMSADDFINNVKGMTSYLQQASILTYFGDAKGECLVETTQQIEYDGSILLEQVIVEHLMQGPPKGESGLLPTIPEGTRLIKVYKKDGICTVDFSAEFLTGKTSVSDEVVIYSIVNSLVEQPDVDRVQILVEGKTSPMFRSISLEQMFERNLNILKNEK